MFLLSTALIVGRWVSAGRRQSHASLLTSHEKYSWKAMRNTLQLLWEIWCIEMRTNCQWACPDGLWQTFLSPFSWLAEGQNVCQGDFGRGGRGGGGSGLKCLDDRSQEGRGKNFGFYKGTSLHICSARSIVIVFLFYGEVFPILPVKFLIYQGSWVCFYKKTWMIKSWNNVLLFRTTKADSTNK